MPKIKEYNLQSDVAGPVGGRRATPDDVGGGEGYAALGRSISGLAEVVNKRKEQSDVSDIHAKFSELHAKYTVRWSETLRQDPTGDKGLMNKFIEDYHQESGAIGETVSSDAGRKYFTQKNADSNGHFVELTDRTRAEQAGAFAKQRAVTAMDAGSASLVENPADHKAIRQDHESYVNELVSSDALPAIKGEELKRVGNERFAQAAMEGWIKLNPQEAKRRLESGEMDSTIDAEHKLQLYGRISQAENAQRIDAEREKRRQAELLEQQREQTRGKFLDKFVDGSLTAKEILNSNLETTGQKGKEHWLEALEEKKKPKTDDTLQVNEIFRRIHLPTGHRDKITDESQLIGYIGSIKPRSFALVRGELQGKGTLEHEVEKDAMRQVMADAYGQLAKPDPLTKMPDPDGLARFAKFKINFVSEFQKAKAGGKRGVDLLSPDSPDSLMKKLNPGPRGFADRLDDLFKRAFPAEDASPAQPAGPSAGPAANPSAAPTPRATVPPRKPGETPTAYKARIGGK